MIVRGLLKKPKRERGRDPASQRIDSPKAMVTLGWMRSGDRTIAIVRFTDGPTTSCGHMLETVERAAESYGFDAELFYRNDYPSDDAFLDAMRERRIRAVLVSQNHNPEQGENFDPDWTGFCVVQCGFGWFRPRTHAVSFDWFQATSLVWREAVKRGYRRIGGCFFSHEPAAEDDLTRIGAALAEQRRFHGDGQEIPPFTGLFRDRDGFARWIREQRPDAVIGFSHGVVWWLRDEGYRVPEDIGFAALNLGRGGVNRPTSGLRHFATRITRAGTEFILMLMEDGEYGIPEEPRTLMVEPTWHEGETLPDRARR